MTVAHAPTQLVFESMGTVVTVLSTVLIDVTTTEAVKSTFRELDERFSLYREDSEASAIRRDRSLIRSASELYRDMYSDAVAWLAATGGAFTPHRPDGVVDLSSVVKARGIEAAGDVLVAHGHLDWCLNAGGDILVSGALASGEPWSVGIETLQLVQKAYDIDVLASAADGTVWASPVFTA